MSALEIPDLSQALSKLSAIGDLQITTDGLTYLKIDDDYIHRIFPLLPTDKVLKPDYFSQETNYIGAHISVIYPEEQKFCDAKYLLQTYSFEVSGLFAAIINNKKYYALKITAPALVELRHKLGLAEKLSFKNYLIDLHITVGVEYL